MAKKILLLCCAIAVMVGVVTVKRFQETATARYTIGILQTASHPALDAVREGFTQELRKRLGKEVAFVVQNAQGSVAQAHSIAQQFSRTKKLQAIFAIATPAAQAVASLEKERPVFIAAVTDPEGLGLMYSGTNVCGVNDMINIAAEIDMIQALVPHAKTVGLLYASGELNSVVMAEKMKQELEVRGIVVTEFAISIESDVQVVTELACRKVDLILAPVDNMIALTIPVTSTITRKHKKPFIVSDLMLVKEGPLAARGVDYKLCGTQTAQIAYEILCEGRKPSDFVIQQADSKEIFINQTTLDILGLTIPDVLKKDVVVVH